MQYNLITILGPTAVGKTKLAVHLASRFNGEIISADSRQVYKGMNIGTGKDLDDYIVNNTQIPCHLIDIAEPNEEYNLYRFKEDSSLVLANIISRNRVPFLVGGTGLYLSSVIQQYELKRANWNDDQLKRFDKFTTDELLSRLKKLKTNFHNITDLVDRKRIINAIIVAKSSTTSTGINPDICSLVLGIKVEREEIKKRITQRLKKRLDEGMIDEVKKLMEYSVSRDKLISFGLEYKYICLYLTGEVSYNDMFEQLNRSIHKFAKRQMTWFRKMEREGIKINWIDGPDFDLAAQIIRNAGFKMQ